MLAGGCRAVERALALAAVEAGQMSAAQRDPGDVVAVDIHAARRIAPHRRFRIVPRNLVVFGEGGFGRIRARIQPHDPAGEAEHAAPDHSIGAHGDRVERRVEARVFESDRPVAPIAADVPRLSPLGAVSTFCSESA